MLALVAAIRPALKPYARQIAIVFGLWTLVALCSGLADYAYLRAVGVQPPLLPVLRRPLTEQWIWALLTPLVFHLARRVPLARPHAARAFAFHVACFFALSFVHCAIAEALHGPLASIPAHFKGPTLLLRFLQEVYSDVWMYWPLVGIRGWLDAQARERERERQAMGLERSLAETKLSLLRAQIQPHFLFNTLHAISALLRVDPRAAEDMVADLAEILRASFADGAAQEVPLARELELVRCYLRIQQARFGDRLMVDLHVADDAADAAVPALMLQSLVENAVVHGIAPLARPGRLAVRIVRAADRLSIEVADDGAGLPAEQSPGLGLANTRARLAQLHGDAQALAIASTPGRGTTVTLQIPYRRAGGDASADGAHEHAHEDLHPDRGRRAAGAAQPVVAAGG
ncbi:MAG: histidine kinase [Proteobacteria bacterium]|nr:histidine kinase [Pseudomonadota bacterium]